MILFARYEKLTVGLYAVDWEEVACFSQLEFLRFMLSSPAVVTESSSAQRKSRARRTKAG